MADSDTLEQEKMNTEDAAEQPVDFNVSGFLFKTKADVDKANIDLKKIVYLEKKVSHTKPSEMRAVYEKAIENKIFGTPVGWEYLILLRNKMHENGISIDDLTPIPMEVSFTKSALPDDYVVKQRIKVEKPKKKIKFNVAISVFFNIVMVLLVIGMFAIAYTSETDNILNYKVNVTNRYAEWNQSLTERERAVRQKEKELGIEDTTDYISEEELESD